MKIGVYGGSFNPPHKGHQLIAETLLQTVLDKIIFVPTGNCYSKEGLTHSFHRYNMLKLICTDKMSVSKHEFQDSLVRTYQTLNYFKNKYPNDQIYFVCGADNLREIETWKNYEDILRCYGIIVVTRHGYEIDAIYENIIVCEINSDVSSTKIRQLIKEGSFNNHINHKVKEYIVGENLYRE